MRITLWAICIAALLYCAYRGVAAWKDWHR